MTLAEFPDTGVEAHRHAVDNKARVWERFGVLARELAAIEGTPEPEALADRLALVMDGVYGSVAALGTDGPAREVRRFIESLLS